jgi:purine-binding chemotaxis protein CheW
MTDHDNAPKAAANGNVPEALEYVTFLLGDQLFGISIAQAHEVFAANQITRVPSAPQAIMGLLNLRGRVVTAVCLRTLLRIPGDADASTERTAIGVEHKGEHFALVVDEIGDVLRLPVEGLEDTPIHLDEQWQALSCGVHRLDTGILVVLDPNRMISSERLAA